MNYEIIKDEELFKAFISWLPELEEHEFYYLALFARRKYVPDVPHIKTDKQQLKRFLTQKDRLYRKVKQMECAVGAYVVKDYTIPQEALALYISVNPRDMIKATRNGLIRLAHLVGTKYNGWNVHQEIYSTIHKSKSKTRYVDFDFDLDNEEAIQLLIQSVKSIMNIEAVTFLRTYGGVHVLIKPDLVEKQYQKNWYRTIASFHGCDVKGDNLIPVVGCTQGNFVPHFII